MIGKTPATGRGFRGIVNYLMRGKKGRASPERVAWFELENLAVEHPDLAPAVMRATANRAKRCGSPVYHLVISWHRDEQPTPDLMKRVARDTLGDIGLAEHQRILLAHEDTGHKHLHIVVNRVHGETGKAWDRWQDWVRIERSLRRQSEAMGMPYVPGRHNDPKAFFGKSKSIRDAEYQAALRNARPRPPDRISPEQLAARKVRLVETISKAKTWEELDRALAADNMTLKRKGQGLVILTDDGFLKLSELKKDIRLKSLEGRFNERYDDYAVSVTHQPDRFKQPTAAADSAADDQTAGQTSTPLPIQETPRTNANQPEDDREGDLEPKREQGHQPERRTPPPPSETDTGSEGAAKPRVLREHPKRIERTDRPVEEKATPDKSEEKRRLEREKAQQEAELEAKKQQLRDERRRAREAAELRDQQMLAAKALETDQQKASAENAKPVEPPKLAEREPTAEEVEAQQARKTLSDANAEADLAFKLHDMGLITRKQLARAVRDRDMAKEATDAQKTGAEKLTDDLRDALKPTQRKPKPKPAQDDDDRDPPPRRRGR